jgi:hypothetical protein
MQELRGVWKVHLQVSLPGRQTNPVRSHRIVITLEIDRPKWLIFATPSADSRQFARFRMVSVRITP